MAPKEAATPGQPDNTAAPFDLESVKSSVNALKSRFDFSRARRLLSRIMKVDTVKDADRIWFIQQLALCTYKDKDLLPARRFRDALHHLETIGLLSPKTTDAETLALGGAVYKRMWDHHGQLAHLHEALYFYREAFKRNPDQDRGYGGVNAAYILDILSDLSRVAARRKGNVADSTPDTLAKEANDLRRETIMVVDAAMQKSPKLAEDYWLMVTLAEAHFGLGEYPQAGQWVDRAMLKKPSEWEIQTTFRQLTGIARLQGIAVPTEAMPREQWHEAWQVLPHLLPEDTPAAIAGHRGKVGLALSGGGFRASLYHLGVMARLAEMDVLRTVETLSTVSGGSIVGAHYYLELQRLLEDKQDKDIKRKDYIAIVRRVQERFLKGVQRNIRMRALASIRKNLGMIFSRSYSRSHRLGELYEEELYAKVADQEPVDHKRTMEELLITPMDEDAPFHPTFSNWRRRAKVPALLLNTTSLNTGHNWHFTARFMGEPPGLLGGKVDKNTRYRRLWYDQAPTDDLKKYQLGHAVAASACVPGLFEPLSLARLYPKKTVQLVDGGVHDNQGVEGLLYEGCNFILCSDASGQMSDLDNPSNGMLSVLKRSNAVMMDRVREAEYQDVRARTDSSAIRGLFFVHLKKDLSVSPQDWIDCQDKTPDSRKEPRSLPYGIDIDLQTLISEIRTDLDSFTEVEAYALMCSGYLMTAQQFQALQAQHEQTGEEGTWGGYKVHAPRETDWPFLQLEDILKAPSKAGKAGSDLRRQLKVASCLLFKIWRLDLRLKVFAAIAAAASLFLLGWVFINHWGDVLFTLSLTFGGLALALGILLLALRFPESKWFFPQKVVRDIIAKTCIALFGYLASRIHLGIFDKMFLKRGRLKRLLDLAKH